MQNEAGEVYASGGMFFEQRLRLFKPMGGVVVMMIAPRDFNASGMRFLSQIAHGMSFVVRRAENHINVIAAVAAGSFEHGIQRFSHFTVRVEKRDS